MKMPRKIYSAEEIAGSPQTIEIMNGKGKGMADCRQFFPFKLSGSTCAPILKKSAFEEYRLELC